MKNIGLTTNRSLKILENVQRSKILTIDLSFNPQINKPFYEQLAIYLDDPYTNLRRLILEGNKMGDTCLEILCKSLLKNTQVTYLNFSKNEITDVGLRHVCTLLSQNDKINVLFLHWNRILGKGGA